MSDPRSVRMVRGALWSAQQFPTVCKTVTLPVMLLLALITAMKQGINWHGIICKGTFLPVLKKNLFSCYPKRLAEAFFFNLLNKGPCFTKGQFFVFLEAVFSRPAFRGLKYINIYKKRAYWNADKIFFSQCMNWLFFVDFNGYFCCSVRRYCYTGTVLKDYDKVSNIFEILMLASNISSVM